MKRCVTIEAVPTKRRTISVEKDNKVLLDTGAEARACPTFRLRRIMAYHALKSELLGATHDPHAAQAREMVESLACVVDGSFDTRTLSSWSDGTRAIQPSKLVALDAAYCLKTNQHGFLSLLARPDEFPDISGGWYLHWHLAALDAACFFGGGGDDDWFEARTQAGLCVLESLQSSWTPDLRGRCPAFASIANDSKRGRGKTMPNRHDHIDPAVARRLQYAVPTTIPIFLAAIAADDNFLTPGRIERWAFDLASAAASLYAVCQSDRHAFELMRMPNEAHLIGALRTLFWQELVTEGELELQFRGLIEGQLDDDWKLMEIFLKARNAYWARMNSLGITCAQIERLFLARDSVRRTVFSVPPV